MKTAHESIVLAGLLLAVVSTGGAALGATLIIADNYNVTGDGTGFALNTGVNSGINPPTTRMTGSGAANLRYLYTQPSGGKSTTAYSIGGNKLKVAASAYPGRFTLSGNGTSPFNFASLLGVAAATPAQPVVYELNISMANSSAGTEHQFFALSTVDGAADTWDFGIHFYRTAPTDNYYTIGKRIDTGSCGLAADLYTFITNTVPGTYGSQVNFRMRVTDAGAEGGANYNSRVQLSMDGGVTWFYDTATDPDLPNGWRLNAASRYLIWDQGGQTLATYDNFSLSLVPPISATLVSPQNNAPNLGASPVLQVSVSNAVPGDLTVTFYGREAPKPYPGGDFAIAVLPDTQNYASEDSGSGNPVKEMWIAQTEWIVTNRVHHNIAYVAHLGDIVQSGDVKDGNPNTTEWRNATNAMYRLEHPGRTLLREGIPYGLAVGNHDQEPNDDPDGTTDFYNQYFGVSHFSGKSYYGGHYSGNNDSHYDLFSAGGLDFIVLYFENERYGSAILNWADTVLAANPHRRAIVVTHYTGSDTTPSNFSNQGQAIYDALKSRTNLFLMLGGHVFSNGGEGSRTSTYGGRTIRSYISDYQNRPNGGNGWMRLMYFSPSNNLVTIKTYSPWLDQYETDANSQMSFTYDMQLPGGPGSPGTPYVALGTNAAVSPGSFTTRAWPALQPYKTYEWCVKVTDTAGNSVTSPEWRFTTASNAPPYASNQLVTVTGDQPAPLNLPASDPNGDALTFQLKSPPLRGLVSGFDPAAGTLVFLPARGFRGTDRLTFQADDSLLSTAVATLALNVVAPPDTNGNGLPDTWEGAYGISDPYSDADDDGQSNLAEYLAGTNPTNAASVFRIISAARQQDGYFGLSWSSVGGTRYRVRYSDGDATGGVTGTFTDIMRDLASEMDASLYGTASTKSFTDTSVPLAFPTNAARYYRVQIVP